jgi:hypothetical protein
MKNNNGRRDDDVVVVVVVVVDWSEDWYLYKYIITDEVKHQRSQNERLRAGEELCVYDVLYYNSTVLEYKRMRHLSPTSSSLLVAVLVPVTSPSTAIPRGTFSSNH